MPEGCLRPLDSVVSLVMDKAAGTKEPGKPYVGLEHIPSGGSSLLGVVDAEQSISTNGVFRPGDILFGKLRPRLRKSLLARVDGYCSTDILVLRPCAQIDSVFAGFVLRSDAVFAEAIRTEEGTKMPRCSWSNLRKLQVFCPPLPEQRRIAGILDTVDEAIRKTEETIAKLKQVKQGLLHDLLTRGIDENGQLRPPPSEAPHLYKDSPLGLIPREWDAATTLQVALPGRESTTIGPFGSNLVADDYRSLGVPVIFVRDIRESDFQWNSAVYVTNQKAGELQAHRVVSGDVLATKMGLPPCIAAVYPGWMPDGVVTADIIRLRPDPSVAKSEWVAAYLNHETVKRQVRAITGGVTRPKITLADFRRIQLPVPPRKEQESILLKADDFNHTLATETTALAKLRLLRQGLMDDLLTGRVRVSVKEDAA